jgi:transposase InsO family protein
MEFVYLAVVLDAFSRRVIGWALGRTVEAGLAIAALARALAERKPQAGLVHHSDRGVQYASREYTALLEENQVQISMSRKGNPYDNAACEWFMKTLKYEEVYRNEYCDLRKLAPASGSFSNASTTGNGFIRRWDMFRRPSLKVAGHEQVSGTQPARGLCPCDPGI